MTKVVVAGAGGHAKSLLSWLPENDSIEIVGLLDDFSSESIYFWQVLGQIQHCSPIIASHFIVGIGQIKTHEPRKNAFDYLISKGFTALPACFSSKASVSPFSKLGDGTAVFPMAIVSGNAKIGQNCILNHMSLVEHDCEIGNHVHISTGAKINGSVIIEDGAFIGSGTVICEGVHIGAGAVIGAGLCIKKDVQSGVVIKTSN